MPVRSPHPDVEIPSVSLWEFLFADGFGEHAGSRAFVDGATGASLTFGELHEQVLRVAAALAERGVERGDVVAVFARNSLWWPVVFHGVLRANAVITTVNVLNTADDLAAQLTDAGARMLVTTAELQDRAAAAAAAVALADDAVVVLDGAPDHPSGRDLLAGAADPPALAVGAGARPVLPYSSGTSGRPKGVMLTHRNLVANVVQIGPRDRASAPTTAPRGAAVLPHLRHDGAAQRGALAGRAPGHDAEVRPRRVPADRPAVPACSVLHRAADRARAGQASDRRPVRPVEVEIDVLRRGAAGRRARPGGADAAGLPGASRATA